MKALVIDCYNGDVVECAVPEPMVDPGKVLVVIRSVLSPHR